MPRHEFLDIWSGEDSLRLFQLRDAGVTWSEIGRDLDRTASSCRNRMLRIRLGRQKQGVGNTCRACGATRSGHVCMATTSKTPLRPVPQCKAPSEYLLLLDLYIPEEWYLRTADN